MAIGGTTIAILGGETGNVGEFNMGSSTAGWAGVREDTPGAWSRAAFANISGGGNYTVSLLHAFGADHAELNVAFRYRPANTITSLRSLLRLKASNATTQLSVAATAAGLVAAYRGDAQSGGALLGTGATALPAGVWRHLEVRFVISDSVGQVQVWVDGVLEVDLTGIDTKADGSIATVRSMEFVLLGDGTSIDDVVAISGPNGTPPQIGEVAVAGLLPTAAGEVQQLTARPGGSSPSRLYYSTHTPDVLPGVDAAWVATAANRGRLLRGRDGSPLTSWYVTASLTTGNDAMVAQFVSEELAAQTIGGTVKGQIRVREYLDWDQYAQLVIKVVSGDGATVRGTLLAAHTEPLSSEFGQQPNYWNRKFPLAALSPATLSPVTCEEGDRLVVEVGAREAGGAGSYTVGPFWFGAPFATADLPEDETTTTELVPWIEFSGDITFLNYASVDDPPAEGAVTSHDSDASYVEGSVTDDRDLYQFEDLPAELTTVGAVGVFFVARKLDAGPGNLAAAIKSGGVEATSPEAGVPAGYAVIPILLDTDPTDSASWTRARVNALQAGPKIR